MWARPEESQAISALVTELEDSTSDGEGSPREAALDGTWELVYSDIEPFRASTFFLAVGG